MPKTLTESTTYAANITVPQDGEPRTAASVETPFQQLADRTKNLNDRVSTLETKDTLKVTADYEISAVSGTSVYNIPAGSRGAFGVARVTYYGWLLDKDQWSYNAGTGDLTVLGSLVTGRKIVVEWVLGLAGS